MVNKPVPQGDDEGNRLDRPELREKLARELCKIDGLSWDELDSADEATIESVGVKEDYLLGADAILALIPDEEEIRKSERERIAKALDETPKKYGPDYKVCFDKNDWLKFLDKLEGKP